MLLADRGSVKEIGSETCSQDQRAMAGTYKEGGIKRQPVSEDTRSKSQ
jgi:hypothetical protein